MESLAPLPESGPTAVAHGWWVVCLCADWCGTCRDYRPMFEALARAHPSVRFEWVDVEDAADLAGDLEVETFPTLLIADGRQARFLGPLLPQAAVLERLLASLQAAASGRGAGDAAQQVFERVRADRPV
ncbi:MAG: thioredoxin family protein [Burkholderiaceae bacterium]|nr:thioredoxin family protein [Burkholderiaceae bacterium]